MKPLQNPFTTLPEHLKPLLVYGFFLEPDSRIPLLAAL